MADHAVKKGPDPEQAKVLFGKYNTGEIWESARPELTAAEVEKIQLKILHRLKDDSEAAEQEI